MAFPVITHNYFIKVNFSSLTVTGKIMGKDK